MNQERTPARGRAPAALKTNPPKGIRRPAALAEPAWNEVANFVLTFESRTLAEGLRENRITAHKMQDGGLTAEWRGVEQQAMCGWIAEHLGDWAATSGNPQADANPPGAASGGSHSSATSSSVETRPTTPRNSALPAFRLEVTAVRPRLGGAANAQVVAVEAQPFDIEASIVATPVSGDAAHAYTVPCAVEFHCRNTVTAEKFPLGSEVVIEVTGTERAYTAVLSQVSLAPGLYRVACIARLTGAVAPVACGEGPLLQVG